MGGYDGAVDRTGAARPRVAVISLHTSPLDQPGTGDSGGMNVYIREATRLLGERGFAVDVFTRCAGRGVPEVERLSEALRVIQVQAGPCAPVEKGSLPRLLPAFLQGMLRKAGERRYDIVHAHYWLSGWAGRLAASAWGVPLVASFHTLGRVKNLALAGGEIPEPPGRLIGEQAVIRDADRVLVPTPAEAQHLARLYRADPARIRVVTPGVDARRFAPRPRARPGMTALYVGRLQPHKGPDVAIRAVAEALRIDPGLDLRLSLVGGPSGGGAGDLRLLARDLGIEERVELLPPIPHEELPGLYASADVVLMPSRSESFGLVALEAQAVGVPVIAAAVGGLRQLVRHGESGYLVEGHDPRAYAERILELARDPELAGRLSAGAVARARAFPWERTVNELVAVYEELLPASDRGVGMACAP